MDNQKPKALVFSLAACLLAFYFFIIIYVFFAILHVDAAKNYVLGMVFQSIGFILLTAVVFANIAFKRIKAGYFIPLVIGTGIYMALLNVLTLLCIATLSTHVFVLLNMVLLFAYCMMSIPMFIMGKQ